MAEKRMFSNKVIGSGRFLRMPPTSRLLYYDLGMKADDDGIVEAYSVIREDGCTEDDLRVLVAKGFVRILNEDLVSQIMDWKTNNTIRADRYHESVYACLISDDNQMSPTCPSIGNHCETEIKVKVKDKIKYINNDQNPPDFDAEFDRIWCQYPRKEGRKAAFASYVRDRRKGTPAEEIEQGVRRYNNHIMANRTEKRYIMQGSTYFNGQRWKDEYEDRRDKYEEFY